MRRSGHPARRHLTMAPVHRPDVASPIGARAASCQGGGAAVHQPKRPAGCIASVRCRAGSRSASPSLGCLPRQLVRRGRLGLRARHYHARVGGAPSGGPRGGTPTPHAGRSRVRLSRPQPTGRMRIRPTVAGVLAEKPHRGPACWLPTGKGRGRPGTKVREADHSSGWAPRCQVQLGRRGQRRTPVDRETRGMDSARVRTGPTWSRADAAGDTPVRRTRSGDGRSWR